MKKADSKEKKEVNERPNNIDFDWSTFNLDKFFSDANRVGEILEKNRNSIEDGVAIKRL